MEFEAKTEVSGTSDYFDPTEFDSQEDENNSWQVIKNEAPTEDGDSPQYTGCDDSYKIAEWNATGVNLGFNWYCPAVRGSAWNRIVNPAGFTIDWILKTYNPADSNSVDPASSPGGRNTQIHVSTATTATLPDAIEQVSIEYSVAGSPSIPIKTPTSNFATKLRAPSSIRLRITTGRSKSRSTSLTKWTIHPPAMTTPVTGSSCMTR